MKKKFTLLIAVMTTLLAVKAADFTDGFYHYKILDEDAKTAEVTQNPNGNYHFGASFYSISETVNGYTIVAIGENAFKDATGTLSGNYPFIWSFAHEIKAGAFDNCHISFVGLQGTTTSVDPAAFKNNKLGFFRNNSESFTAKVNGTEIGALWNADLSRLIAVPGEWRTGISTTASNRTNYTLPAATTTIGAYAFYGNTVVNTLNLGNVTTIESEALANMTALRTLTIPATATTIASDAFAGTTGITTLNVNLREPVPGVVFADTVYNALRDRVNFAADANIAAFQADPDWGKFFTKASDDVYILGEVNFLNWDPTNGVQMAYDQNNDVYRATVYTAGSSDGYSYFSFTKALGNWDEIASSRIGAVSQGDFLVTEELLGQPLSLTTGTNAFKIPEGKWNLTLSLTDMTLTISEVTRNVWVLGNVNGADWAANAGALMTYDANSKTYTLNMKANGENDGYSFFSFTTELASAVDGWDDIANYRIGAVSDGDFLVTDEMLGQPLSLTHGTNAFKIPAGSYTLALDLKNYNLNISEIPFDVTPFQSGVFYFRPIGPDEVEYIHPSEYDPNLGPYSGSVGLSEVPATVTHNDVTYRVTTIGEGAFRDATIQGANSPNYMIWFDSNTTTIKADAFNGWKINMLGLRATDIDPTAFRNNKINAMNANSQDVFGATQGSGQTRYVGDLYKNIDGKKILWAWCGDRRNGNYTSDSGYNTITTSYTFSIYDEIGDYALYGNANLQTVTIQKAAKIGREALAYMTALKNLTLPAELTEIGEDAFKGITSLTSLTVNATVPPTGGVFETDVYEALKDRLVVPEGSEAAYRADENWGKFFSPLPDSYTITVAEAENGTVIADKTEAEEGETVTVTATPAQGYELTSLTYTAEGAEPQAIENGQFTMPAANVTINATFSLITAELNGVSFANNTYASWYGDQNLAVPENVTAYVVTGIEGDVTIIEEVGYIPAGVGVLLYSTTPADVVNTTAYTGQTAEVASMLQGYFEDTAIADGYVLYKDVFVLADNGTLPAHRCYLPKAQAPAGAPMRLSISQNSGVVTAIDDVRVTSDGSVKYVNPMGQVSNTPFQGVNIVVDGNKTYKVIKN
ncbi:MAG: DUF5115 domain-containing protein [Muribaculaceae bacterium]|nr:DUF5115 domain-containing protein [Muribaculaceae bacterium]